MLREVKAIVIFLLKLCPGVVHFSRGGTPAPMYPGLMTIMAKMTSREMMKKVALSGLSRLYHLLSPPTCAYVRQLPFCFSYTTQNSILRTGKANNRLPCIHRTLRA